MKHIEETEFEVAKDIINKGLKKAAETFSFFMKEPMVHKDTDFIQDFDLNEVKGFFPDRETLFVLTTELRGEFTGICFLVLRGEEADALAQISFNESLRKDQEKYEKMKEALLLEVDNIISATVVTQFANILDYHVFGDVPKLAKIDKEELLLMINGKLTTDRILLFCTSGFKSHTSSFRPEFFWILDSEFVVAVKRYIEKEYQNR